MNTTTARNSTPSEDDFMLESGDFMLEPDARKINETQILLTSMAQNFELRNLPVPYRNGNDSTELLTLH